MCMYVCFVSVVVRNFAMDTRVSKKKKTLKPNSLVKYNIVIK